MIKINNRDIAFFLLLCFLPVITPKEFIHGLFGHEDTSDVFHVTTSVEKVHKHCSLLQMTFSTFFSGVKNYQSVKDAELVIHLFPLLAFIPVMSVNLSHLRAPPADIS
jgi:hypothetical protein